MSDFRVGLGSTHVRAGQGGAVPVHVVTGVELTRLDFALRSTSPALRDLRLEPLAPEIDAAVLQPLGGDAYAATFLVAPGATIDGDRDLARLVFDTASDQSALAQPLPDGVTALATDGVTPLRGAGASGRVFVVARQPVIEVRAGSRLVLQGVMGRTYSLEAASSLGGSGAWHELRRIVVAAEQQEEVLPAA